MTEDEERDINPSILKQRIDGLEWLIGVMMGTMTEDQKGYLAERLADRSHFSQQVAQQRDTDPARDEAAIAYELCNSIANMADDSAGGFAIYLED
jgi:hypothetical protein